MNTDRKEYQKNYKKFHYSKTRKVVTFPLLLEEYEKLQARAKEVGITPNTMSKTLVVDYLDNVSSHFQSKESKEIIQEYMRISRGIATNINQMARSSNIGEIVDINILINSLKAYEDEFKKLLAKLL
jgi:hypothetical protein